MLALPARLVLTLVIGTLLVLSQTKVSAAHTPTPGSLGTYDNPQTFKVVGAPSWLAPVIVDELENHFHYSNNNPERKSIFDGYGHYEDELVKVNGQWLFSKRRIYNEGRADCAHKGGNPAW